MIDIENPESATEVQELINFIQRHRSCSVKICEHHELDIFPLRVRDLIKKFRNSGLGKISAFIIKKLFSKKSVKWLTLMLSRWLNNT